MSVRASVDQKLIHGLEYFFVLDMRARNHAQRQHIIHSVRPSTTAPSYADRRSLQLDTLLYQLHTVSFFLAPSLWSYVCRLACQSQLSKPKELESPRSLRFLFGLVIVGNVTSVWSHSTAAVAPSSVVVLDFVGFGTSSLTCVHHRRDHICTHSQFAVQSASVVSRHSHRRLPDDPRKHRVRFVSYRPKFAQCTRYDSPAVHPMYIA